MAPDARRLWPLLLFLPWLASPLVVLPAAVFPFVTGKVIATRLGLGIAAAALLLARRRTGRQRWPLLAPLLAWLAIACLSALRGLHPRQSFWGGLERLDGVVEIAAIVLAAALLAELHEQAPELGRLLPGLLSGVGAIVVGLAILEFSIEPSWSSDGRLVSTIGNSAITGAFASLIAVLAIQITLSASGRRQLGSAFVALGSTWLVWGSGSRLPLAALILGATSIWVLRSPTRNRWSAFVLLALAAVLGATTVDDSSAAARRLAHRQAFEALKDRPLLGHGPGSFAEVHLRTSRAEDYLGEIPVLDRAHGAIAEAISTLGVAGLAAWSWLAFSAVSGAWRCRGHEPWRMALMITAAPLLLFGIGDRVLAIPLLLAAMIPIKAPRSVSPLPRWLLIAALVGPVSGSGLRLAPIAFDLAKPGDPATMVESVAAAAPWQEWPLRGLARSLGEAATSAAASPGRTSLGKELAPAIAATRSLLDEERARRSGDLRLEIAACRMERGAVELGLGDSTIARRHLQRAFEIAPGRPEPLIESIWLHLADEEVSRAQTEWRRLRDDYPGFSWPQRRALSEAMRSSRKQELIDGDS